MQTLENLEMHVAHSCNLTCESCSHYSNQGHQGVVTLEQADEWMALWDRRLLPAQFSLLGGEPTLHPRLTEFVLLARRHWPLSRLRVVTNGFFLHRHPDLGAALAETEARLDVSVHHDAPEYRERLAPIVALTDAWQRRDGIIVSYRPSYRLWTRRYRGVGAAMEPFEDQRPQRSWKICPAKYCRQLFEGKIWKCSPLAYLRLQDAKYGLSEKWKPYLAYRPLEPDCSDEELGAFFDRREESVCGMCSAKRRAFEKPLPLRA